MARVSLLHRVGGLVVAALGLLFACDAADEAPPRPALALADAAPETSSPNIGNLGDASTEPARVKVDILFIVDDSASMAEEQASLAQRFGVLTTALDAFTGKNGAKLDYRVAVTTTGRTQTYTLDPMLPPPFDFDPITVHEDGADGHLRKGCSMTRPWLEWTDPDLAASFACIANVGLTGPSIEMPLETMKLALVDRVADGANRGFLRDDALLSVIVVTDADDCSRTDDNFTIPNDRCADPSAVGYKPVADYLAVLDTLKGKRERWSFAAIAAPTPCVDAGDSDEAVRLKNFVSIAGQNAVLGSICSGDLQTGLDAALGAFEPLWKIADVH